MNKNVTRALWAGLLCLLALAPFVVGTVEISAFQKVVYLSVAVMSLNVLTGFNGQASIGHSAFMGIAAYFTALAVQSHGWSYWAALPASILVAALVGALAGVPALRIRGMNLALVTLGLGMVFPQLPIRFTEETGGTQGMPVDEPLAAPAFLNVSDVAWRYWVLLALAALVFWLVRNFRASRVGRAVIAIRDQPIAAHTAGVNVAATKIAVFAVSAGMAGLAGWMFTVANQFVSPSDFTVLVSINLLLGMAIGGSGTLAGPVIGAVFLHYIPEAVNGTGIDPVLTPALYGLILILVVYFLPGGAAGGLAQLSARFAASRRSPDEPGQAPPSTPRLTSSTSHP
ncbi:branched-chain amino acid transport system permease protein [Thermomonospora echinospora]|uniref:Branched-chain amino acid transport system permease protein n=1 Tax=Thermomonospora echinospora TaxID=1992 RepID=A0A1H6E738_9ACTN|nr:branched-chain amino acid ABC transporter permease [Thermomonospora echinospora]SEG93512.1 branched-chain amino acid transport system permease protein [Thermomonospora echinospora]